MSLATLARHHTYHLPGPAIPPQLCDCHCGMCETVRNENMLPITCPECGAKAKSDGHFIMYRCTNGVEIPMVLEECNYRCTDDECGFAWCEDGSCLA